MPRKRSSEELDRLAIEAVRLQRAEKRSASDIAVELKGRGEPVGETRDIRFLLDRAAKRKLVKIKVEAIAAQPDLDVQLAEELANVTNIRRVMVVKRDQSDGHSIAEGRVVDEDTSLHESLGVAAAIRLAEVLRDNDHIAVGAGRAVSSTIRALGEPRPGMALEGLSVTSVGGGMLRAPFTRQEPDGIDLVDADYNAAQLALALGVQVANIKLCYLPAFAPAERCDGLIDLVAPHLRDLNANVLLYGGGVVDEAHYLLRMEDPQTQVIRAQAEQLRAVVKRHRPAVIDFCDEFFVSPGVPEDLEQEVAEIVTALRSSAIRIDPSQLARPAERILVAGGRRKVDALVLLTDPTWEGPRPTTLVTDGATARTLVEVCRHSGGGNGGWRAR